ncbi:hypothetical protein Pelo_5616 [Pelomyxa schiedti]|nr:hypothetical protein Pelo_5616 [Pelomyxa schiedti]
MHKAAAFFLLSKIRPSQTHNASSCSVSSSETPETTTNRCYEGDLEALSAVAAEEAMLQPVDMTSSVGMLSCRPLPDLFASLAADMSLPHSVVIVACILAQRCCQRLPLTLENVREIALACLVISSKILLDDFLHSAPFPAYAIFARAAGVSSNKLASSEKFVLSSGLRFNLCVDQTEYPAFASMLGTMSQNIPASIFGARPIFGHCVASPVPTKESPKQKSEVSPPISARSTTGGATRIGPHQVTSPRVVPKPKSESLTTSTSVLSPDSLRAQKQNLSLSDVTPLPLQKIDFRRTASDNNLYSRVNLNSCELPQVHHSHHVTTSLRASGTTQHRHTTNTEASPQLHSRTPPSATTTTTTATAATTTTSSSSLPPLAPSNKPHTVSPNQHRHQSPSTNHRPFSPLPPISHT